MSATKKELEARREELRHKRAKLHAEAAHIRERRAKMLARVRSLADRIAHYVGRLPRTFFDSVVPDRIPASAQAFAGYVGGAWPTYAALRAAHPKSKVVAICTQPDQDVPLDADVGILDVEEYDANPEDYPGWHRRQRKRGVKCPLGPYASLSWLAKTLAVIRAAKIPYSAIVVWSADPDGKRHITKAGDYPGVDVDADATQYLWTQGFDESACRRRFWTG